MQQIDLWQNTWEKETGILNLQIPEDWNVECCDTPADHWKPLTRSQIRNAINMPYGMQGIQELARNGKEVCIAFDDLSRGTPVQEIAEVLLEELHQAGITDEHIRFICALGTHGPLSRDQMVLKLGEEIIENYLVLNHNVIDGFKEVGKDRYGNAVEINKEFMSCDVRIGIGSVCPHPQAGFGGGGKIIIPGLASINTIYNHHSKGGFAPAGSMMPNRFRDEINALAEMCNPFFKIDAVLNSKRQIVALTAGEIRSSQAEAAKLSAEGNALSRPKSAEKRDVVIANANIKINEPFLGINVANAWLRPGGDIVLVNFSRAGLVPHYLCGYWGQTNTGRLPVWTERKSANWGRLIYYSPYPEKTAKPQFQNPERVFFAKTWEDVLSLLGAGQGRSMLVLPEVTNTYWKSDALPQGN